MGKVCTKCGKESNDNAKFCSGCGAKYEEQLLCKKCGAPINSNAKFCSKCGSEISNGETKFSKEQEKNVKKELDSDKINGLFIFVREHVRHIIENYKNFTRLSKAKKILYVIIPVIIIFFVILPFNNSKTGISHFTDSSNFNETYTLKGLVNGEYQLSSKESEICQGILSVLASTPADPSLANTGLYSAPLVEALANVFENPEVAIEKANGNDVYKVSFSGMYSISADRENFVEDGTVAYKIDIKNKTCDFESGSNIDDLLSVYAGTAASQGIDEGFY